MEKVVDSAEKIETPSNIRYERKFIYQNSHAEDIIQRIYRNSYGFKEVFYKRKVNNIYFDDSNYSFYKQNVEGVANRKKLRLRWYGYNTEQIEDPTVEVKKKMGEAGDKFSFPLKKRTFDLAQLSTSALQDFLFQSTEQYSALNNTLKALHPTLLNTYERRYFLSFCGHYRITVDFNQRFFNPNYQQSYTGSKLYCHDIVLELKYATKDDLDARQVSQQIDARLSKNSKYVTGINLLYHPNFL